MVYFVYQPVAGLVE